MSKIKTVKLNRRGSVPLHAQIHANLRQRINTGKLEAGGLIPSERELSEMFGVSRMTVRQALRSLRQEGMIFQERGVGTFVAKTKFDIHTRDLSGFSTEMRRRGLVPSSKVLSMWREKAMDDVAESLNISVGDDIFTLRRLRLADGMPLSLETTHLPASMFPDLDKFSFDKDSLYTVLSDEYGVQMESAEEVLEATVCTQDVAKVLKMRVGTPVLLVQRTVFGKNSQPIETVKSIYRGDRYRVTYRLP